jgi:hypothetical protein
VQFHGYTFTLIPSAKLWKWCLGHPPGPGHPFTGTPVIVNGQPIMATKRRRYRILVVALIGVAALTAFWMKLLLFSGEVLDYKVSPDTKYIAEYRFYEQGGGATATNLKGVEIRTQLNPFRHTIIDALDYGADLTIQWIDSRNLLIKCPNSGGKMDFYGHETKWHDVTIHYDLDDCQIANHAP